MGKLTVCIGENKAADQLRSTDCEADQRLCFRNTDSTIPLLSKYKIFSLLPSSVTVQPVCFRPDGNLNYWFSHAHAHSSFVTS